MKINLTSSKAEFRQVVVRIEERLPVYLDSACELSCEFEIVPEGEYHLLTLQANGTLEVSCQRCLQPFVHEYVNTSHIAVCQDEITAEKWMDQFDCIVANNNQVDLLEVLTDELHLFVPERHVVEEACYNPQDYDKFPR